MKQLRPWPQAIVTRKAARSLAAGHPWVFADEVLNVTDAPDGSRSVENGCIVDVVEQNGTYQGTGLLSENSKIRIRIVSRNANDRFDEAFWARKVAWAWQHRLATMASRALSGAESDTTCCRMIFSEADDFPGLVVDKYDDVLVSQVGTVGMDRLRQTIYPLLVQELAKSGIAIRGIYERNDGAVRTKEGLPQQTGWYDFSASSSGLELPTPDTTHVLARENGLVFDINIEASQKTGFFLDQKYNRRAVRELAAGRRVLDCFSHVGPFGLNAAAGGAEFVRCVDISQVAIDLARNNARLNQLDGRMEFTCANVLEYLPQLAGDRKRLREEGGPFDLIVLDPPAFAKSRGAVSHATKGYREINAWAMRLLPRGGYLATCSCSHFMTTELLRRAISQAAHDAGVRLRQVEERQQAPDHPILWGVPETHYLDFFVFQVI